MDSLIQNVWENQVWTYFRTGGLEALTRRFSLALQPIPVVKDDEQHRIRHANKWKTKAVHSITNAMGVWHKPARQQAASTQDARRGAITDEMEDTAGAYATHTPPPPDNIHKDAYMSYITARGWCGAPYGRYHNASARWEFKPARGVHASADAEETAAQELRSVLDCCTPSMLAVCLPLSCSGNPGVNG